MSDSLASRLTLSEGPRFHTYEGTASDAYDMANAIVAESGAKIVSRVVRGTKARSSHALFDELAAAWQFPPYFGENWDAADECINDLEWLPADHYVITVTDAHLLLKDERPEALRMFLEIVRDFRKGSAKPATLHVIFQTDKGHAAGFKTRFQAVGGKAESI